MTWHSQTARAVTPPAIDSPGFGGIGGRGGGEWAKDSKSFLYGDMTRADKVASFYRVDAASGTRKRLAFDSSATYVDQEEFHVFPGTRGTMAMSERDRWKHLYLFDTTGAGVRQLTSGPWLVARNLARSTRRARSTSPARGAERARSVLPEGVSR